MEVSRLTLQYVTQHKPNNTYDITHLYNCFNFINEVRNGTMHSVQEHINTLGINCSIQRLTEGTKINITTLFAPCSSAFSVSSCLSWF